MKTMYRTRRKRTTDALEIMDHRYFRGRPEMSAFLEEEMANAEIAQLIYDLRAEAGLTQKQFAKLVDTTASVISRLEDADYDGHSLSMLARIAVALKKRIEIRFVPIRRKRHTA